MQCFLYGRGGKLRSRVTLDSLRPLPQFLGIAPNLCLSAGAFTPPVAHMDKSTIEKVKSRVSLNISFFLTNYMFLSIGVGLVVALSHPGMLISVTAVAGLWTIHNIIIDRKLELIVKDQDLLKIITPFHRWCFLMALSIIVGVGWCLVPLLSWFLISSFMILVHAGLRDPKHIETSFRLKSGAASDDDDDEHVVLTKSKLMEGATMRRQDVV